MAARRMTSKGRITIPASIRTELKLKAGDRVEFVKTAEGHYFMIACNRSMPELKGKLRRARSGNDA